MEKDVNAVCKDTLNGCAVVGKIDEPGLYNGIVNKKGVVVQPGEYKIIPYGSNAWYMAHSNDGNKLYNIFFDGTVLSVSLEVI